MKRLAIAIAATFTAIAPAAFAQYGSYNSYDNRYDHDRYENRDSRDFHGDRARVLQVTPVADATNARQECWNPRAGHYEEVRPENHSGDKRNSP